MGKHSPKHDPVTALIHTPNRAMSTYYQQQNNHSPAPSTTLNESILLEAFEKYLKENTETFAKELAYRLFAEHGVTNVPNHAKLASMLQSLFKDFAASPRVAAAIWDLKDSDMQTKLARVLDPTTD